MESARPPRPPGLPTVEEMRELLGEKAIGKTDEWVQGEIEGYTRLAQLVLAVAGRARTGVIR